MLLPNRYVPLKELRFHSPPALEMVADLVQSVPSRPRVDGPEAQLLDRFLQTFAPTIRSDERLTIFREPRIQSGYPDLVLVLWRDCSGPSASTPQTLPAEAVKLLHFIYLSGPLSTDTLLRQRGKSVVSILKILKDSSLIHDTQDGWQAYSFESRFQVREIIAIEAKISSWSAALRQAQLNTWFASRSYILIPGEPRSKQFVDAALANNIGIVVQTQRPHVLLRARRQELPASYVSWMLANWAVTTNAADNERSEVHPR